MNRRILLIDADPGFFQTLSDTLSRYAFDVVNEADPEQALLLAAAEPPALLIVGVDEPDKHGFKVFQKCKKGALAKVPIILVTSSVSAESFAKHKGLKTHADEYLDKRTFSSDGLLAKIGALIELGNPLIDDSLDIPLEVDDIPMADGDMVLEEELSPDEVGQVAQQFEAIFLRQMIAAMRTPLLGADLFGSDASNQFRDMSDARLADSMAGRRVPHSCCVVVAGGHDL